MKRLAFVLALAACSSSYMPQTRNRVAVTIRGGMPAYVRDGKVYDHGFLGSGIEEAVAGHPAAMEAANEYTDRMKLGLLGTIVGMGCTIGGLAYAAASLDVIGDDDNNDGTTRGVLVALGCTVVMLAGAGYMGSAEPYRWDAINLFNDSPPTLAPPPPYARKASLQMRD